MIDTPSPESIITRPVKPEDQSFLVELYKSSRGDDLRGLGWDEQRISEFLDMQYAAQQNFYESDYRDAADELILLEDKPIGRMMIESRPHEIRCIDLGLLPEYRERGLGTEVIQKLQEKAKREKKPLRLQVIRFSRAASLFDRLGFVRTSETGTHFQMEWTPDA
ncbi:MAG TPA: GNAT family N-acetyltransferase [Pyrinomonadaceae bacterium]|nr:GNAT family N-acetyltransferase [Pyrinomonadaceae bacterium]